MLADLFAAWTLPAVLTFLVSGLSLGAVIHLTHLGFRPLHFLMALTAAVLFMYVPQSFRLAVSDRVGDPDPLRNLGVALMVLLFFVVPAWLVLTILSKLER
jgi:hypothetical protein